MRENLNEHLLYDMIFGLQALDRKPLPFLVAHLARGCKLRLVSELSVSTFPLGLKRSQFKLKEVIENPHLDLVDAEHVPPLDQTVPAQIELAEEI